MNGMNGGENESPVVVVILPVISKVGGGYRAMCEELRGSGVYSRIQVSDSNAI
jgi:hypothetical protein